MSAIKLVISVWIIVISFLFLVNPAYASNTSSLTFDGTNDYVEADGVVNLVANTKEFSFGSWVRPTTKVRQQIVGFVPSGAGNNSEIWWGIASNPNQFSYFDNTIGVAGQVFSTHLFSANQWFHVFVTINSQNTMTLYVNGEVEGTTTTTDRPSSNGRFSIGQDWDNLTTSDFTQGQIDDVRVYNKALTQDQVKKAMRDGWNDGLVARFKFDENTGCTAFDSVSNIQATLLPTCSSDSPTWHSTIKAPLDVAGPNINDGVESKGSGDYEFIGKTSVENSYIIDSINYSINNSPFKGVGIKDGVNDESDEEFDFNFRSDENNAGYEGFLLDVKVTDSGSRENHKIHFEPFNLTAVKKLPDNNLEFKFNVHQNRNLMKDKLNEYHIGYTGSSISKTLLANIPIDFENVRNSTKNLASHEQGNCSICNYEDTNMKVEYSSNNSTILVTTKNKFPEQQGKYTFKAVAQSKDNLPYESNGKTLDTTSAAATTKTIKTSTKPATPSPSPKPTISTYTPPEPKPQGGFSAKGGPTSGWNLEQIFVNFHLWLFSLFPWSPVAKP